MKNEKQIRTENIIQFLDNKIADLKVRMNETSVDFADFYTTAIARAEHEKTILLQELSK